MSNLRLINETVAVDGVSSVNVTDVFNSDYDIYKITFTDLRTNSGMNFLMRWINSSGSVITASEYDRAKYYLPDASAFGNVAQTNQDKIDRIADMYGYSSVGQTSIGSVWVFNPFDTSAYTFFLAQGGLRGSSNWTAGWDIGVLTQTNSIGGFQVYGSNTFKTLNIRTYGLRVD